MKYCFKAPYMTNVVRPIIYIKRNVKHDYYFCCHIFVIFFICHTPSFFKFQVCQEKIVSTAFAFFYCSSALTCQINPKITTLATQCVFNIKKTHYYKRLKRNSRSCLRLFFFVLNLTFLVQHLKILWINFLLCFVA